MMIVVGIPTCIGTVGFVLNYKFCQHYDEEQDVNVGGYTICECITACLTCGKALKAPEPELDEFMERYKNPPAQEIVEQIEELNDAPKAKAKAPADGDKAEIPNEEGAEDEDATLLN